MASVALRDLCDVISKQVDPRNHSGALYIGLEHVTTGRFLRTGGGKAIDIQSSKFAFKAGDILYGKLRPYLDKAILADEDGVCSTELLVLRPRPNVDARFLIGVLHCRQFVEHAMSGTTGVQHPRTSWHRISEFRVPHFGADEWSRIADLIWAVHRAIVACEKTFEAASVLKRVAMRELFARGLRGEAQKETQIGPVPESWDIVELGSLGRVGNGSTPKRSVPAYWRGGSCPWLTSAKVYDRFIVEADEFVTEVALSQCHLPMVKPGAVLIAITGQGKTLGHCAVLGIEATISQHLAYVALDQTRIYPAFICGYLETLYGYLRQVASGGGSTKGALTCAFLRMLPVPLPSLEEQREIATVLDAIDQKIGSHKRKQTVLDELFKTLLQKLMTGEIRVADLDLAALDDSGPSDVMPGPGEGRDPGISSAPAVEFGDARFRPDGVHASLPRQSAAAARQLPLRPRGRRGAG